MQAAFAADPEGKLSSSQKFVLLLLANNANDEGLAVPSIPAMSRNSNLDDRTIRRAIDGLAKAGYLTIRQRPGRAAAYQLAGSTV